MAIIYEKRDRIAYLTLNRPEAMNAIDPQTREEIAEASEDFNSDPDSWVLVLTGAGKKAFCAGADLKTLIPAMTSGAIGIEVGSRPFFADIYKPIIAAINGFCLAGGTDMILGTDIRIAAEHATFALPEPRWGLAPIGSHVRLPRQVPWCRAMEILLIGDPITAQVAYEIWLINKVVPLPELIPEAERIARRICENAPLAVRAIKELAIRGQYLPIEYGLRLEQAISRVLAATEDAKEGPRAFAEKRKPSYTGR